MLVGRDQVVAGRNLKYSIVKCARLMVAVLDAVIDRLGIPPGRHASGKQGLDFGSQVERVIMKRIKQRLDAKAIASRENRAVSLVPNHKSEFSAQPMQALRAEIFVKVERDFAVGARAQVVSRLFEFSLDRFKAIEFAIHHDPGAPVFARNGLVARRQVDDAETRVSERDPAVLRPPVALPIGAAMIETLGGSL